MNVDYQNRMKMLTNYRAAKPYERQAQRIKNVNKQQLAEPEDNLLQSALDKYRFHTLKSKGHTKK